MMSHIDWSFEHNVAVLHGELSIFTIDIAFEKQTARAFYKQDVIVDLAAVNKIDTAGLAWLLCLVEKAKETNSEISFHNIPQDLLKLAKLSAVDLFLPTKI